MIYTRLNIFTYSLYLFVTINLYKCTLYLHIPWEIMYRFDIKGMCFRIPLYKWLIVALLRAWNKIIRIKIMYLTCFHSKIFTLCKVYILYVYVLSIHLTCKCLQIQQYLKLPTSAHKKILTWSPFTVAKGEGVAEMLTYKERGKGSNLIGFYISRARLPLHKRAFKYYVSRDGGEGGLC